MEGNNLKILIFSLNNEYFATDIGQVERIIGYEKPTVLPDSPNYIDGVIKHEGKILPILNLNKRFSYIDQESEGRKIIIVKRDNRQFGIVVDNVYEVKTVDLNLLEGVPPITNGLREEYISGLVKLEDRIVILLNLDRVLSEDDETKIF